MEPYVRPARANARLSSLAGKTGQKFLDGINSFSFDCQAFAYTIVSGAQEAILQRILQVFYAVIHVMVIRYDNGEMSEATTAAKRLSDTISLYELDKLNP